MAAASAAMKLALAKRKASVSASCHVMALMALQRR
jgi:hypothetical protein